MKIVLAFRAFFDPTQLGLPFTDLSVFGLPILGDDGDSDELFEVGDGSGINGMRET